MKRKNLLIYIFLLVFLFNSKLSAGIYPIDYSLKSYPSVTLRYFLFDKDNMPVFDNNANDYRVLDNGSQKQVIYQNCLNFNPAATASILIDIDLSLRNDIFAPKFDKAISIIGTMISNASKYNARIGIASYDELAYLNSDFTSDTNALISELMKVRPMDGSIADTGFLQNPLGSIHLIKNQKEQKTIIWFTSVNSFINHDRVIAESVANNIKIITVFFGKEIPSVLSEISEKTGGLALLIHDSVTTDEAISLALLSLSRNFNPCDLTWLNQLDCNKEHITEIIVAKHNSKVSLSFIIDDSYKPRIERNPEFLRFSSVYPGTSKTMNVTITAKNGDITVTDLFIQNPKFTIDSGDIVSPILLTKDSSRTIRVRFNPTDSAIVFDSLIIKSNACSGTNVLITGGYPNTPPKDRTLTLISPICNDHLIVNDTATVKWSGLLPADVIQLQYSTDNGKTWDTLATDITGLEYEWIVPDKVSDSCLVRIIQLWPNNVGQTMVLRHQAGVNCANFNQDGSFVITASKDNKNLVRIWNANNGQLVYELAGHTKPLNWVNFDYQDKYAVSASDDSTAIIWDVKKGESIRQLIGHKNIIRSANFSPSGKYIVTAGADGNCYIWDVQTGTIIDSSFKSGYSLWYANFSPDEKYIVITDNNGKASIFDFQTKSLSKVFTQNAGVVPYASFSQDMKKFTACSWFGQAKVWDFASETELYTVKHDSVEIIAIYSSNFDISGNLLITAGYDTVPRLWDANTGKEIATLLNEHTSSVMMASFNFDAKRILTASWDSTAKVWNREQIGLQVDTSDCTFSIHRIKSNIQDVDFGDTPVGYVNDTIVSPFVSNLLPFPLSILGYEITGPNANDFEVINSKPPYKLDSMGTAYIELRFKPSGLGLRTAKLELLAPGTRLVAELSGNGTQESIVIKSNTIYMGPVEIGDSKDSVVTAYIRNTSNFAVRIDSVEMLGPDFFHFNITSNLRDITLSAGEEKDISLRFNPEITGRLNTVFRINHNGVGRARNFAVLGEGILPRIDTAKIIIGSAKGKPGETIEIPVKISGLSNLGISPEIKGFNLSLQFNSTLLAPVGENNSPNIINGSRFLNVVLPSTFSQDSVLASIKFIVGLGNDTSTILTVNDISLIGSGKMVLSTENGLFELDGYCRSGDNRLFESEGKFLLLQNAPNPANDRTEISFEIIESGITTLFISDITGNRIKTIINNHLKPGQYSIIVNTVELPSGLVFYTLQTPGITITKAMSIMK